MHSAQRIDWKVSSVRNLPMYQDGNLLFGNLWIGQRNIKTGTLHICLKHEERGGVIVIRDLEDADSTKHHCSLNLL